MTEPGPAAVPSPRRLPRDDDTLQVPRALGARGRFVVDATWGTVQPLELAPGLRTLGELELIAHIEAGLPLVDTRLPHFFAQGTIPTARSIPHGEILERIGELDRTTATVVFCNGPQCAATPWAVENAARRRLPGQRAAVLPRRHPRLGHAGLSARPGRRAQKLTDPSGWIVQWGLWATSHGWPSGSTKTPE